MKEITFGGFIDITDDMDLHAPPEGFSCHDCKHEGNCEVYDFVNDDVRYLHKICELFVGEDRFEPKE